MSSVELLIRKAKEADASAINSLLSRYRNYLAILATTGNKAERKNLNARFDDSDVVQNTLIDAFKDFAKFKGHKEPELMAWLRKMLACNLADLVREHHAEKRDVNRQIQLASLSKSSQRLERLLPQNRDHPQKFTSRQEVVVMLADTLAQLPKDYREVIVMRHLQKASFDEIADQMGRSPGAVRMLWTRAIASLKVVDDDGT